MTTKKQAAVPVSPLKKQRYEDALCVNNLRLFFPGMQKDVKQRWIDDHSLWLSKVSGNERVLTPIVMSGLLVWMDAITGSTYSTQGQCMTSDILEMDINSLTQNQGKAAEILMELKYRRVE